MKIFLDTVEPSAIDELTATGLVDGAVTTAGGLAAAGEAAETRLATLSAAVSGPVTAEVTARDAAGMVEEGQALAAIAPNIAVTVPVGRDGLKACRALRDEGIMVNVALCP